MKILCVCQGGNNRSVHLAYVCKARHHDAIAVGTDWQSRDTLILLATWADRILIVDPWVEAKLLGYLLGVEGLVSKCTLLPVGPDRWPMPHTQELIRLSEAVLDAAEIPDGRSGRPCSKLS